MDNTLRIKYLEEVIKAAEEGRYCHGNGASWFTVGKDGKTVVVYETATNPPSTHTYNAEESARYISNTKPHKAPDTAKNLRDFIKTLK
jgi:hypothetical protein